MAHRRTVLAATTAFAAAPAILRGAPKPKLKYVQLGTSHPHANKIGVYHASDDWEVVGIVEPDEARRRSLSSHKSFRDFPLLSLEEAFALPDLQCVGVETAMTGLLDAAEKAVEAGFHVHLDKPAGEDLEQYRRILANADRQNLVVQMGYMFRFNPAVQLLHRFLKEGYLGEVFETHAVLSKVLPPSGRSEIGACRGGLLYELGCHIVDLTVGVLGQPDQVHAFPRASQDDGVLDNMLAVFEYPKATATVKSAGVEIEGNSRRHFVVCGTEGTAQIQPLDRPSMRLSLSEKRRLDGKNYPKGTSTVEFNPPYQRYVGDAADLAAIIRGEKPNPYPSKYDLAVQETVLRASGLL